MILDAKGQPMKALPAAPASGRRRADTGSGIVTPSMFPQSTAFAYEAAKWQTQEMGDWLPTIRSPDTEINQHRDRMVARTRDLYRNDCWAYGAIARMLDSTIGANYRLLAKPHWRWLRWAYGAKFDESWAADFVTAAEAIWAMYSEDAGHYNDVERKLTVAQQFRLAFAHKLRDGESLLVRFWLPDRIGYGGARYATAYQVVDPDRLSNEYQKPDTADLRGGVEIDEHGAPVAYYIRRAHQNDWYNAAESMQWERVPREDDDGWQRVIHGFDMHSAGQNRGVSVFTPVIARLKMLARYYGIELQAATVAATFGTFITSPYDPKMVEDMLAPADDQLNVYQGLRVEWQKERPAMLNGARVPILAPGEQINSVSAGHPHSNFSPFTHEMLRGVAAVTGLSTEQVTNDYSEASWSSARAGIVEAEKMFVRRLQEFNVETATPVYAGVLEEAMELGQLPLPSGAPDFAEARTAYSKCQWLGAARGWVDPVAEREGELLGLTAGFGTLEQSCARQGLDWEEVLAQRAKENQRCRELGIDPPEWMSRTSESLAEQDDERQAVPA